MVAPADFFGGNSDGKACSITDCTRRIRARGWCNTHYERWRKHGDPLLVEVIVGDDEARFARYVDRSAGPDGCWPFTGYTDHKGYGKLWFDGGSQRAHRVAFFLEHGKWPDPGGLHHCDNPPCCNPAHIYEGTDADNARDRHERGRFVVLQGEDSGSAKLTERDVRAIRRLCADGRSHRDVGRQFGISHAQVGYIVRRQQWAHVDRHEGATP